MLHTEPRITDEQLATRARELAQLLNALPIPPIHPKSRPTGDHSIPGRATGTDLSAQNATGQHQPGH